MIPPRHSGGERTFAWPGDYRRPLPRQEQLLSVYQGLMAFVAMLLCVDRLAR